MGRAGRLLAVSLYVASARSLAGYGEYCPSTTAVTPAARAAWAEEPWCDARGVQDRANYTNRDEAYLNEFQVVDLSQPEYSDLFCCTANYTAIIALNATVEALDEQAQKYYEAADRLLSRYNCEDFYPFLNCTPCQYAYRTWVCSIMFPRKCRDAPSYGVVGHVQKVCKDVCYEVVRKCPVELEVCRAKAAPPLLLPFFSPCYFPPPFPSSIAPRTTPTATGGRCLTLGTRQPKGHFMGIVIRCSTTSKPLLLMCLQHCCFSLPLLR